ncbi:MAG: polysaccharide deacetylase family protein [Bacteroidales bacterium]
MMKKSICLYFQVHQPTRLRLYRFFDIGKDSHYYDDFANRTIMRRVAQKCYLPMNALLLDLVKRYKGAFKVAFSISGSAIEQMERYVPDVLESFRKLAATGSVEFLSETYYHSLSSLASPEEFKSQVLKHKEAIKKFFGVTPTAFRNTELIYSDEIGKMVRDMGFNVMLTEGAKHILGWKSPDYMYSDPIQPDLSLLLRDYSLSDDIAFRFSNKSWSDWPLTGEKYLSWLKAAATKGDIVNLFMDYETFGEHQSAKTGIFDFMRYLPEIVLKDGTLEFVTPSQASKKLKPIAPIEVPETISWADEERDVTAWLGNELQQDAFHKLYALSDKVEKVDDSFISSDFGHLQESDHFYYMCTKFFSDGEVHKYFNPYDTPYEAYINYMNVLSDFIIRVNDAYSELGAKFADKSGGAAKSPKKAGKSDSKGLTRPAKITASKVVIAKEPASKPAGKGASASVKKAKAVAPKAVKTKK